MDPPTFSNERNFLSPPVRNNILFDILTTIIYFYFSLLLYSLCLNLYFFEFMFVFKFFLLRFVDL